MAITEPTKIKLEFKEAVYMYGGDYNQGFEDGKSEGLEEGKAEGYNEGVEFGKANAPKEERTVTYKANGSYEVIPSSSELSMSKVNVNVEIPDDGSYSDGYQTGYAEGEAYGKQNAPAEDLSVTLTSNGTYSYPKPSDKYHADVNVIVDVPSDSTPTQEKTKTITKNGTEVISPDDGYVLEKVTVITDIPERLPTQTKTVDIEENGTEEVVADNGYALEKVIINTDIDTRLPEQDKTLEVTENKVYEVTPDDGFALSKVTVNANVGGSDELVKIKTFNIEEFADNNTGNFTSLIKNIDWTEFNKLKTTNFSSFFANYQGKYIDLKNLDTSNATNMYGMFSGAERIVTIDFGTFDTSKVTTMESMFSVSSFSEVDKLSNWDVSKVTTVRSMFSSCRNFSSIDLTKWITSSLTSTNQMFYQNLNNLKTVNLSGWDTTKLTDMYGMFSYSNYLETVNLSGWDTSKVTSINIFDNCYNLKNVTFGNNWASNPNVTSISYSSCPFTKDTILDLANKIADKSDTSVYTGTYTVKLKSSQKNVFTSDEQTTLANLFTSKNWTLSWG